MEKTLKRKFIVVAMTAVSVLLVVLIAVISVGNYFLVDKEIDRTLQIVAAEAQKPNDNPARPNIENLQEAGPKKNRYDTLMASNYVVVQFDSTGAVTKVDVSRSSAMSEQQVREFALGILNSPDIQDLLKLSAGNAAAGEDNELFRNDIISQGLRGNYRYSVQYVPLTGGTSIALLDVSEQNAACVRVVVLALGIGVLGWILMLLFVSILAKHAIKPVIESMVKQKQFVTNAGHEIKTPLAIIRSNVDAYEMHNGENKWSKTIKEQVERMTGLTNGLLTLSKSDEAALTSLPAESLSLTELIQDKTREFTQPIKDKNINYMEQFEPGLYITVSKTHITEVISILMQNAVKYTDDGGYIKTHLERAHGKTIFTIENSCKTLPKDLTDPEKLFDRFYRGDEARTQSTGGFGIGLSVARADAELCGGKLTAHYIDNNAIEFALVL